VRPVLTPSGRTQDKEVSHDDRICRCPAQFALAEGAVSLRREDPAARAGSAGEDARGLSELSDHLLRDIGLVRERGVSRSPAFSHL